MFRPLVARALIGVGGLVALGGAGALSAAPAVGAMPNSATAAAAAAAPAKHDADHTAGVIVSASSTELTIRHRVRDAKKPANGAAAPTEDVTFVLNQDTRFYKHGDKDRHDLGPGALKPGERVRVRFEAKDGKKIARVVVILPDLRAGEITAKDGDSHGLTLKTRDGKTVHVTVNDKTRYFEGRGKNRKPGTFADLKVGDRVVVAGEEDSAHNFDAVVVRSHAADHPRPAAR
jgi:hypothetical protein